MDIETVNALHRQMKQAETAWLDAGKLSGDKHHPIKWTGDPKVLYRRFMDAYRDWKDAHEELEKEIEQRR
jgi:hypothetical protein